MLKQTKIGQSFRSLRQMLWLPDELSSFMLFMVVLTLLSLALLLHIQLSVQILETRSELDQLQRQHAKIEQENAELIWRMNQNTSLDHVRQRALILGFVPIQTHHFLPVADLVDEKYLVQNATDSMSNSLADKTSSAQPTSVQLLPNTTPFSNTESKEVNLHVTIDTIAEQMQEFRRYVTTAWQQEK
ncbi:hypothetical protein KFU94_17890 [Chloroflexi bacterium TSY]|nr:hypothetical protein [Chloroflexi bacterium TSY]